MCLSKIRKVQVIYNPAGICSARNLLGGYSVSNKCYYEEQRKKLAVKGLPDIVTVYEKEYPKDVATKTIWEDIRNNMRREFFMLFYPSVIEKTSPDLEKIPFMPEEARMRQREASYHLNQKFLTHPEQYVFKQKEGKWVLSMKGYIEQTTDFGNREMQVGLGKELAKGEAAVEYFMRNVKDDKIVIPLFVYPDKYDAIVRARFELIIYFY
jgi:hypothetical protein